MLPRIDLRDGHSVIAPKYFQRMISCWTRARARARNSHSHGATQSFLKKGTGVMVLPRSEELLFSIASCHPAQDAQKSHDVVSRQKVEDPCP